jgi:hypothetical protein
MNDMNDDSQLSRYTKLGDLENMDRFVALNWEAQRTKFLSAKFRPHATKSFREKAAA